MFEVKGKHGSANIYTDLIDESTISQIQELVNQEFIDGSKVAIMPDCHAGTGCVIGTTIQIKDKVVPNLVGVDIGCGMLTVNLGKIDIDFEKLDNYIHNFIPHGHQVNEKVQYKDFPLKDLICFSELKEKTYLEKSLGSLGGGNHFIEIDKDEENNYFLVIHSGSRYLGKQVAEIYQKIAIEYQTNKVFNKKLESSKIIEEYKKTGKEKEIEKKLKEISNLTVVPKMPKDLCYLEDQDFKNYIHDMEICQNYATLNRNIMASKICNFLGLDFNSIEHFETIHNYINMDDMILRKGAIAAYKNEIVLIPINMRDGCIVGVGKSCKEYNFSAPHGAGRILSRGEAKFELDLEEYQETMKGIFTTCVSTSTIDESPMAYKPLEAIVDNIKDTVDIIKIIKPVYNFKAN